jgi:hypothetical protein
VTASLVDARTAVGAVHTFFAPADNTEDSDRHIKVLVEHPA